MFAIVLANVALVAANNLDVSGDLNNFHTGCIGKRHASIDEIALLPTQRIEAATDGLEPIPPLVQWSLTPDFRSPGAKFLELHERPSRGKRR
jgi:hypothetical protein